VVQFSDSGKKKERDNSPMADEFLLMLRSPSQRGERVGKDEETGHRKRNADLERGKRKKSPQRHSRTRDSGAEVGEGR